jgi:hypothetical protein
MPPEPSRRFEADELRRFLAAVDRHLADPAQIILLGGSAIALYGVPVGTTDIDTWETDLSRLQHAIELARTETGLNIPVSPTPVGDVPYDYADRLQRENGGWTRLEVLKLERHDLALSKTVRAQENDLAAIEGLHHVSPLDLPTLFDRYVCEMGHVVGDRPRLDRHFILMVERLYGEPEAERREEQLRLHRRDAARRLP